jgi:hypothetical protein
MADLPTNKSSTNTEDQLSVQRRIADIIKQQNDLLKQQESIIYKVGEAEKARKSLLESGKQHIQSYINTLKAFGSIFDDALSKDKLIDTLSVKFKTAISDITIGALKASQAFKSLDNVDNLKNINLYSTQLSEFIENATGIKDLASIFSSFFGMKLPDDILEKPIEKVKEFITVYADAADNQLKLQQAFLASTAVSGDFGKVLDRAGVNLQNLNNVVQEQNAILDDASRATGLNKAQLVEYYKQLSTVPGALFTNINLTTDYGTSMNMLTAATKLAAGTGQSFGTVVSNITEAIDKYNASQEDAIRYAANISEISKEMSMRFKDVQEILGKVGEKYGMITNKSDVAVSTLATLSKAFRDVGLSSENSKTLINQMFDAVSNLTLAQKSFLSVQTGGPGGLMGAFQIELLEKQGKIGEVFKKVTQSLKQQFGGKIVTLEEAALSQEAAAQFNKQRLMLQQGPLGQLARDPRQATRILEAMSKGGLDASAFDKMAKEFTFTGKMDEKDPFKEAIERGNKLQERQVTLLSIMNTHLEAMRSSSSAVALEQIQKGYSAAGEDKILRAMANETFKEGVKGGVDITKTIIRGDEPGDITSPSLKVGMQNILKYFVGVKNELVETIDRRRKTVSKNPEDERRRIENEIKEKIGRQIESTLTSTLINEKQKILGVTYIKNLEKNLEKYIMDSFTRKHNIASSNIRNVAQAITEDRTRESRVNRQDMASTHQAILPNTQKVNVHVNVTGYCIRCKNEIDNSQHTAAYTGLSSSMR